MNKMIKKALLFITVFLTILYFLPQKKEIQTNFYFWENSFKLTHFENQFLQKLKTKKLYIKFFDISYQKSLEFIPTTVNTKKNSYEIIPVIYIENQVFLKIQNLDSFISTTTKKIKQRIKNSDIKEIQFDCDWSLKTKKNYFYFLKKLKKSLKIKISATIRLHQIKYYQKTGVPPIDFGVLMYYNMESISDYKSKNSILNNQIAKKYHYNFDSYPLKLKIALPLYSQGVLFRYEEIVQIIEGIEKKELLTSNFEPLSNNRFKVLKSHYFKARYIYKDDIIRFENSDFRDLKEASEDLNKLLSDVEEVIFYRVEEKFLKGIGYENLQNIVKCFN